MNKQKFSQSAFFYTLVFVSGANIRKKLFLVLPINSDNKHNGILYPFEI